MPVARPELPYHRSALQPYLSSEQVNRHHEYQVHIIERLNALTANTRWADCTLEELVRTGQGQVAELAGMATHQARYWLSVHPRGGEPNARVTARLQADFGGAAGLKQHMIKAAASVFGSGWVCLVQHAHGHLAVVATRNGATAMTGAQQVLLACSLWEHAYYLDYRQERSRYLDAFWTLANWEQVNRQLA